MDSIDNDPRFSHIASDPRFRPMPKHKRKVKIDKRFDALFSSKHFKTRTDIDKRGRPVQDISKRNKHVMERFYELSSDDSDEDDDDDKSSDDDEKENGFNDDKKVISVKDISQRAVKVKKKGTVMSSDVKTVKPSVKKRKLSNSHSAESELNCKPSSSKKAKLAPQPPVIVDVAKANDDDGLDSSPANDALEDSDADRSDDASDSEDSDDDKDSESGSEDGLPDYTADFDIEETGVEHKWNELHADAKEISESTRRLAVCNMDWDFVKAQDLFVLFKSFAQDGGRVKSVIIYPSDYGKERMADEALMGPKEMRDIAEAKGAVGQGQQGKVKGKKKKHQKTPVVDQKRQKDQEKEIVRDETEKLREYQLNRLRYYYAVVDCDSVATADAIYNECDGQEFQLSSVRLDLRYIPDDMTFDDEPKESFSEEQGLVDYVPRKFNSTALSQAKVEVTWDETDFDRLSKRMAGLQQKELESIVEDNQYADLIAPPESDSEGEASNPDWLGKALDEEEDEDEDGLTEEKKIQLYRKVLMDKISDEKEADENEVDQEYQWVPGLKSSAEEKLKKRKKDRMTDNDIVEGYLEKKRLKKKKKMEKKKNEKVSEKEESTAFSDDDMPSEIDADLKELMESEGVDVPKKAKGKKKSKQRKEKVEDSETEREKAELELLMMDDSTNRKKSVSVEDEGKMSRKKKRKLAKLAKKKKEDSFALDMEDKRFNALFTSHHFHIDPNAPQFKKTQNMVQLVDKQISRKKKLKEKSPSTAATSSGEASDSKLLSKQLVDSLKKKMKKK